MYQTIKIASFRQFAEKEIRLGKYVTVLAGRNSTGKSTILGLLANSSEIKKNIGETYTNGFFRAEFSEIIKGSKQFDLTGSGRFQIVLEDGPDSVIACDFRTSWQKYKKEDLEAERFRVIPKWTRPDGTVTEAKLERPVLYLGLSRLFPIGESQTIGVKKPRIKFDCVSHERWFIDNYKTILSINEPVQSVTNYSIGETDKKIGVGVTTDKYDYLTNSSGQDNLGQILLSILSFKRIAEKMGTEWKGGLLLIDEIDATLHPIAQIRLYDLLVKEAKATGFQVSFTTHSISLLQHVSERTDHNNDAANHNIELYYFTTANRTLDIIRNPEFHTMQNDLMLQSLVHGSRKIKVYSEDAETRWFLKYLIKDYSTRVDVLETQIGCHSLMTMYRSDPEYFTRTIIVIDGDVDEKTLDVVPKTIRDRYKNIIRLPKSVRPEQVIYEYILSLDSEHDFWKEARSYDMTWQYFKENGPESEKYKRGEEREWYKTWFVDHVQFFELTHLGEYWVRDNSVDAGLFIEQFKTAYNAVARRTLSAPIKD